MKSFGLGLLDAVQHVYGSGSLRSFRKFVVHFTYETVAVDPKVLCGQACAMLIEAYVCQ